MNCPLCNENVPYYLVQKSEFLQEHMQMVAQIATIKGLFELDDLKEIIAILKDMKIKADAKKAGSVEIVLGENKKKKESSK